MVSRGRMGTMSDELWAVVPGFSKVVSWETLARAVRQAKSWLRAVGEKVEVGSVQVRSS